MRDITEKISDLLEEDRMDEAASTVFMDIANTLNDINTSAGSGKSRKNALKKLEMKIKKSNLTKKMKDAFINGFIKGFRKGAGV